jgi:hypothetical protein
MGGEGLVKPLLSLWTLVLLVGADAPAAWQIERSDREIRFSNPAPGTARVSIRLTDRADDVEVRVNADGVGLDEFGQWGNRGLTGVYQKSCSSARFVREYESVRLFDPGDHRRKRPVVSIDHLVDGNVRVVLDGDRDGRADAEVTTSFAVQLPERSPFCVASLPVRPGLPLP